MHRTPRHIYAQIVAPEGKAPTEVQKRLFGEAAPEGADLRKAARQIARSLARRVLVALGYARAKQL